MKQAYIIQSSDGKMDILVTACAKTWANVSIAYASETKRRKWRNGLLRREIAVPSFEIQQSEGNMSEMAFAIYERYLHENKGRIQELINRLNRQDDANGFSQTLAREQFPNQPSLFGG